MFTQADNACALRKSLDSTPAGAERPPSALVGVRHV